MKHGAPPPDDGDFSDEARALLRGFPAPRPPSAAHEAKLGKELQAMAGALPALTPAASSLMSAKALLGGALGLVLAGAGAVFWYPNEQPKAPSQPLPPASAPEFSAAPAIIPSAAPTPPAQTAAPQKTKLAAPKSAQASGMDSLAQEVALLEQARSLARSAPTKALALLREHQTRFARGQLVAERLFLLVEIEQRQGNSAAADAARQALLTRYPKSTYAKQLLSKKK